MTYLDFGVDDMSNYEQYIFCVCLVSAQEKPRASSVDVHGEIA